MSNLDDIRSSFSRKLDEQANRHAAGLPAELEALRQSFARNAALAKPDEIARRLERPAAHLRESLPQSLALPRQFDFGSASVFKDLDAFFFQSFQLNKYFPSGRLTYPTVYCETLQEFFTPMLSMLDISPEARQAAIDETVAAAQAQADQSQGGGVFGVNLPGQGCYLNGWLFVYGQPYTPLEALRQPELLARILGATAHEKLGHGFLDQHSALGAVKVQLGLTLVELARRFGWRAADDPASSLRRQQHNLIYQVSQLLEEGWATWVENFLMHTVSGQPYQPRYSLDRLVIAIQLLPESLPGREEIQQMLLGSLEILLGEQKRPLPLLHQAVRVYEMISDTDLDGLISASLSQPTRYVLGNLLMDQAVTNLGATCAPYAALIAANIQFDPATISLTDLSMLFTNDPRLHPDARLAALSQLQLEQPGNVAELARRAEAQLSFSTPPQLKTPA